MSRLVRRAGARGAAPDPAAAPPPERREPVLIGPPGAGKSTLARLLAERSGRRVVCLDALRHTLLPILGCDLERAEALARQADHAQWCRYVRPFEHRMLEWVLNESRDAVFDVGAGYVLPLDAPSGDVPLPGSLASCLAAFGAVVHVAPSQDVGELEHLCVERLARRHGVAADGSDWMIDVARYYARRAASYAQLANFEVSTRSEAPLRCVERIEAFLTEPRPRPTLPPNRHPAPDTG